MTKSVERAPQHDVEFDLEGLGFTYGGFDVPPEGLAVIYAHPPTECLTCGREIPMGDELEPEHHECGLCSEARWEREQSR